ncbi:FadR/GntR family transcriptional regulator [Pollutimonas harenae]|uniref:FadR family transcriptional regulator n=1 Tax=Pollutimonas harenae TaxID=657015 RepID=A0A853GZF0_9BURK|nr:FadR/GntR family transcriptional regulator [Pollutimonas harenae]NYT84789.1 FadR family transcriptional regulator [Pollutimonas harenae]TEA72812.1 FadR family transcriptional regulator [Pollutimonas harenae]
MATSAKLVPKKQALSCRVVDELRASIEKGRYAPGDKLPTEFALEQRFGVSRTVIREAISALRADGLLESRQGAGVFVLAPREQPESLMLFTHATDKISDIIEELELRIGIEVEAAGLAASRSSPAQQAEIQCQLNRFAQLADDGQPTDEADFCFHMAIVNGTNNERFKIFLEHVGRHMIPRVKFRSVMGGRDLLPSRDGAILAEHAAIAEAIFINDSERARDAMRTHLMTGIQRYRAVHQVKRIKNSIDTGLKEII